MKYKISEIFYSIQGEGYNTGIPAIFIRFAGCNLKCKFCDTNFQEKYQLSIKQILEKIYKYDCNNIIITGGEPFYQDINEIIFVLLEQCYNIFIESNGTILVNLPHPIWVTISPKNLKYKQKKGNELKLVYNGQKEDYLNKIITETNFDYYYLQPESNNKKYIKQAIKIIKKYSNIWRLSLQCQKIINIK